MEPKDFYYLIRMIVTWVWRLKPSLGMVLVSDVFHHAAHNPLTSIILNTELVLEQLPNLSHPESKTHLTNILEQAKHLQALLEHLKAPNPEPFSPTTALNEAIIRFHQPYKNHHIHWVNSLPTSLVIAGFQLYFQEILSCLIQNAFEAYGENQPHKQLVIISSIKHNHLCIQLCDQGKGMNWLTKRLSCFPGFSQKTITSGLGLAFAKQTIAHHFGGTLNLHSQPTIGTLVTLTIPLSVQAVTEASHRSNHASVVTQPNS